MLRIYLESVTSIKMLHFHAGVFHSPCLWWWADSCNTAGSLDRLSLVSCNMTSQQKNLSHGCQSRRWWHFLGLEPIKRIFYLLFSIIQHIYDADLDPLNWTVIHMDVLCPLKPSKQAQASPQHSLMASMSTFLRRNQVSPPLKVFQHTVCQCGFPATLRWREWGFREAST